MNARTTDDPIHTVPMSDALRALAGRGTPRKLRKGVQIITEGDRGDTLYIVLAGRLRAYSAAPDGREVTYGEYGPGEYVGELGLDGGLRSANVETLAPSLCVIVTRPTLEAYLSENPAFAIELLSKVIWLARVATQNLQQMALLRVYGRLRVLLERHALPQADGTRLWGPAASHATIAGQLGCTRPMISRLMKDLERGGYIQVGRRRVLLLRGLPAKW